MARIVGWSGPARGPSDGRDRPGSKPYDAVVSCVVCGSDLPDGARFCPACGAEQTAPQEERKLVSVLFVDIVGSTARADGADPEDVRDRNQLYYNEARQRIEHYGGIVEKYIGDAVMAVFGTPLAKADDAERAVQAALSIIDGIHELNVTHPGLPPRVRGAVCTGEAVVAIDAAPNEPIATGDVANTAARLQNAAPPGGGDPRAPLADARPSRRGADRTAEVRAGPAFVHPHAARADPGEGQARA